MAAVWDYEDFSSSEGGRRNDDGDYKWVYLQEQWVPAKIQKIGGRMMATLENGKRKECGADQVFDRVLSLEGLKRLPDNLIHTDDMSEQTIIYLINQKFNSDLIYTSIGDILVAVNPYRLLPLYTPLVMNKYMMEDMEMNLRPHPYAVARRSYDHMLEHDQPQSILISGESGAGKTETTKLCLSFLTEIAASDYEGSQGIEQKILASNPILESFGNAKTLRNNNSSRYGKFINLIFNKMGILQGCETKNFLLEKSRVHMQSFGERSYHIFYQLCRAAIDEADCFSMGEFGDIMKQHENEHYNRSATSPHSTSMRANLSTLGLKHPDEFNYLNQSGCTDVYLVSDQENFHEMEFAATKLGFSKKQLNIAFSACACVLHLGNLSFINNEYAGGCSLENSDMCADALRYVADLLNVSESHVLNALTKRELKARGEVTLVLLNAGQATETRDALSKAIYTKCFDFLIDVINIELSVEAFQGRRATEFCRRTVIGVLDIYGFEVFDMNGFEQLFINYANEKLQQHFNHHTFEEEIKACERENIDCEDFAYLDNQETLDLIESKKSGRSGGILKILDDECRFPRGTDEAFLNKLKASQKDSHLISFSKKFSELGFDIMHYAGSVNYTVKDFVEKNKDTISDDLEILMRHSSIRSLYPENFDTEQPVDFVGRAKTKQLTVAGKFQKDLSNLLIQLNKSEPHFIRCIKPNEEKEPMVFSHSMVHRQLKQSGAFDALSIRKRGYQFQFPHGVFMQRYRPLVLQHKNLDSDKPLRMRCIDLIETLSKTIPGMQSLSKNMQVGDTMVFWKSAEDVMLSELRKEIVRAAVLVLQRFVRGGVARCRLLKIQKVIKESRALISKHQRMKENGEVVSFESECEIFQALTLHKDFFESSNIRPFFEQVLDEVLRELELRIDCINQLQLHQHKTLKNIDEGWLSATETAISLGLKSVESVGMIDIYEREVKNHGRLLVDVLKQLQSQDIEVSTMKRSIDTIEEIRKEDPDFATEISCTLKHNVVQLEEENKLVSDILKLTLSDVEVGNMDPFLPFQQHIVNDQNCESLSRNFALVLKVVDYVMELRDITLITLLSAAGEDPSVVPLFPPPSTPNVLSSKENVFHPEEDREIDFADSDSFENSAIVNMSGHVSMKVIENELWLSCMKHFHLFDELKEDFADKEEFSVVLELAAQEVINYREAVTLCHLVVQECDAVLKNQNVAQSAEARMNIDRFNSFMAENCKIITVASSECLGENDADNSSHPYFSKRVDVKNKRLMATQYSLLLRMEASSECEREACARLVQEADICAKSFPKSNFETNERNVKNIQLALDKLKSCHNNDRSDFMFSDTEKLVDSAQYAIDVRRFANELIIDINPCLDSAKLNKFEALLMKSNMFDGLDTFISPSELASFRERTYNAKLKSDKLEDGIKQLRADFERAIENEDEGLIEFLLSKVPSLDIKNNSNIPSLVEKGKQILDKLSELKSLVREASHPKNLAVDIRDYIAKIRQLNCKGSEPHLENLQTRLDILLHCGKRIHSAWYDSPNSVENMVGALQECEQHQYPKTDDVKFVQRFVDFWREDYASYLKALIDLRTFLEDTEAVNELNEELNKLYMKNTSAGDTIEDVDNISLPGAGARKSDDGNRITEDNILSSKSSENSDQSPLSNQMSNLSIDVSVSDSSIDTSTLSTDNIDSEKRIGSAPTTIQKRKKKTFRRMARNVSGRQRSNSDQYVERNQDIYKWYKYPKLRTFTDPERERQRKVYTTSNIPTSVSRMDNIIHIQLATAAFKCLLGIMGDKMGSYPEMLKKEFLRIAAYHVSLTDELYCQLMKQLTKNPNHVSKSKGVEMLQLLVSAVLPTEALQPYLENFLRSHGALEFVNLLRVLSAKRMDNAAKTAEKDNEGWLFITVGKIMKSYRKRWCMLHGDTLNVFITKDHSTKTDTIPMSQIKSLHYLKKKDENVKAMYAFEIELKNEKKHIFYAVNDQDRTRWVEKTKAAVYMYWSRGKS